MNLRSSTGVAGLAVMLWLGWAAVAYGQAPGADGQGTQQSGPPTPVLKQRPATPPMNAPGDVNGYRRIDLDVVVTDAAGQPVTGLGPGDFTILDNGKPQKVLGFDAYNGTTVKPSPPVEVILLIDTVNLPFDQVAFERQQVTEFLKQNGGHLKQPLSIFLLTDAGLRVQPRPSTDGNALVDLVKEIKGSVRSIDSAMGSEGALERLQLSVRQMAAIAENEAQRPGRKLLIWVGPGWPILNQQDLGSYSAVNQQRYFDTIVELTNRLREARIAVYSVSPASVGAGGTPSSYSMLYQAYLKGVRSPRQASTGDLALKVLVTHTGGEILGPDNDLAGQIDRCVADANAFYRLAFDAAPAPESAEYHELKVVVDKPGVTARTNTGYYNAP